MVLKTIFFEKNTFNAILLENGLNILFITSKGQFMEPKVVLPIPTSMNHWHCNFGQVGKGRSFFDFESGIKMTSLYNKLCNERNGLFSSSKSYLHKGWRSPKEF